MGGRNQHNAGLHLRNIDQIGANFGKVDFDYQFCCNSAALPKRDTVSTRRKPSKPIQQTLFADIMEEDYRQAIVFNLHIDTMERGKSYPVHHQMILLIHKEKKLDPAALTPEQQRLYQAGMQNDRILVLPAQAQEAQEMLKQHLTKKKFGYEDKTGQHLITVCSWK